MTTTSSETGSDAHPVSPEIRAADPLRALLEEVCARTGAAAGAIFALDEAGDSLSVASAVGFDTDLVAPWQRFPLSSGVPAAECVRLQETIIVPTRRALYERFPELASSLSALPYGSLVGMPLVLDGACIGSFGLSFAAEGAATTEGLGPLAERLAQRLQRARLVERERQSRSRLQLLAEASRVFSAAGPDLSSVLAAIANQVLVGFASCCSIALVTADEQALEAALIRARDPVLEQQLRALAPTMRVRRGEGLTGGVLETGRSVFLPHIAQGELGARTVPSLAGLVEAFEVRSMLVVPLTTSGRRTGTITVCRYATESPFSDEDRILLEDLGDRAALAIENARLHQVERAARARAEEADRRKDEFLAMLSHELRNPLAPIRMGLEVMRELPPNDEGVTWAREMIARQLEQLSRLVGDLLDVSRINLGKLDLTIEPTDLIAVASEALEATRPRLVERRHQIAVEMPALPVLVNADRARLTQAISNLLDNAAKYTDPGGFVSLRVAHTAEQATVTVEDTGVGIPPEMLGRIFEPFTQLDAVGERSRSGLGIGLTLVKRLVEVQGGAVEASSEGPGRGSRFVLTFPLVAPASAGGLTTGHPSHEGIAVPARRVLVVDDNTDTAESLRRVLVLQGHQVFVVHDGLHAAEAAERLSPDVILLDIGLPGLDGLQVARRLRDRCRSPRPVLVATTGLGRDEDRVRSADAGFDHHLVKPIDLAALRSVLTMKV